MSPKDTLIMLQILDYSEFSAAEGLIKLLQMFVASSLVLLLSSLT